MSHHIANPICVPNPSVGSYEVPHDSVSPSSLTLTSITILSVSTFLINLLAPFVLKNLSNQVVNYICCKLISVWPSYQDALFVLMKCLFCHSVFVCSVSSQPLLLLTLLVLLHLSNQLCNTLCHSAFLHTSVSISHHD